MPTKGSESGGQSLNESACILPVRGRIGVRDNACEREEDDLELLISTGRQESIDLDYKSSAALQRTNGKKAEIRRAVSAFANSAGGVLVYGMKENGRVPTEIDLGVDPT